MILLSLYSHRLCYRVKVKKCYDNGLKYTCRLFDGTPGFKLDKLPITGDNDSSVILTSINGSEYKTVCFYNISFSNTSDSNCSRTELEHAKHHSHEEYVDGLSESENNSTNVPCKSYVKVFYEHENGRQHTTELCRNELAEYKEHFPASSLLVVYWTNPEKSSASFNLRAQCVE